MKRLFALSAACTLLASTAMAGWTYETTIDVTADINGAPKSIAASPGGGLLLTTYFGTGDRPIYEILDPLGTPAVSVFVDPAYGSSNAAAVDVDPSGNVYFFMDTNDAGTSYINKYDSIGTPVAAFGSAGSLSPMVLNVGGTPENQRPRDGAWAEGNRLLVSTFGTPMLLQALDADTGAALGDALNITEGIDVNRSIQGVAYDPVNSVIYGLVRGELWAITSSNPAATIDDLSEWDEFNIIAGEEWDSGASGVGGDIDLDARLYAYTSFRDRPDGAITVMSLDDTSDVTVLGEDTEFGDDEHLGLAGEPTFFRANGDLYLAVIVENAVASGDPVRQVVIFGQDDPTSVGDWTIMN